MFYRCKDCGGNAVYDPKKKKMVCESCGNEEITGKNTTGEASYM